MTLLVAELFSVVVLSANLPKKARFMPTGLRDYGMMFVDKKGNTTIMVGKEIGVKMITTSEDETDVRCTLSVCNSLLDQKYSMLFLF